MKITITKVLLLKLLFVQLTYSQVYNDGADITIQPDAFIHIDGNFTNQGGLISNDGAIEISGDWINTVNSNPLNPGSGVVILQGTEQTIGGEFNTLFNELILQSDQETTLEATIGIEKEVDIAGGTLELNRNVLHILNADSEALVVNGGGIIAETSDMYGYVRWDIGNNANGLYTIPFVDTLQSAIPMTFLVEEQGDNENGYLLLSTYGTDENNNPLPLDVGNIQISGDGSGLRVVDRYYFVNAVDYDLLPSSAITLTYATNEIEGNNAIDPEKLSVINWDGSMWVENEESSVQANTVGTTLNGNYGEFALWSDPSTSVQELNAVDLIQIYPNPSVDKVTFEIDSHTSEVSNLIVCNSNGQRIIESTTKLLAGNNRISLDISNWAQGTYHLRLQGENTFSIGTIVKI